MTDAQILLFLLAPIFAVGLAVIALIISNDEPPVAPIEDDSDIHFDDRA